MVKMSCSVGDAGANIFSFEVRKVAEYLFLRGSSGEHIEHILDAYSHSPYTRAAAALVGIDRNALEFTHVADFLTPDTEVAKRKKECGGLSLNSGTYPSQEL
jgi:hypothetical protein